MKQNRSKVVKVKAWITVSDFAHTPTTNGEYFTRKEPKHYAGKVLPVTISYSTPIKGKGVSKTKK